MNISNLHPWNLSATEARAVQDELAPTIDTTSPCVLEQGDLVAGVDNSYLKTEAATTSFAAVIIMTWPDCTPVETRTATREITFPYVPGLLTFRELPVVVDALANVERTPKLIFCDGHGIAHPRRIGIASHLGLLVDTPTIGIAKKPLRTRWTQPDTDVGATTPLYQDDELVGFAVRTSARRKHPVFVSPGHRIRIEDVVDPVLITSDGQFLPRPQQAAHDEVTRLRAHARSN